MLLKDKKFITLVFVLLITYIALGLFIFPSIDDYRYAWQFKEFGLIESQIKEYVSWNGRYAATLLISLNPLVWGNEFTYQLLPLITISLMMGSLYRLLRFLTKDVLNQKEAFVLSAFCLVCCLHRIPAMSETLYWMAGTLTYTFPWIYLNESLLTVFKIREKGLTFWRFSYGLIIIALLIGSNETIMVMWPIILALFIYSPRIKEPNLPIKQLFSENKSLLSMMFFSLFCILAVVLAPGNSVRGSRFEGSHNLFFTLSNCITYAIIYGIKLLSPFLIILTLYHRPLFKKLSLKYELLRASKRNLKTLLLFSFAALYLAMAPSLWGMAKKPNDRTFASIMYAYYIFAPLIIYQISELYSFEGIKTKFKANLCKSMSMSILVFSLMLYNNLSILKDIPKLAEYRNFFMKRIQILQKGRGQNVRIPLVAKSIRPETVMFKDLDHAQGLAPFYDFKSVEFYESK